MTVIAQTPWMTIAVDVGLPIEIGAVGIGVRRCIPLGAGTVTGAITGEIMPGGADWQTVRQDGTTEIEARYVAQTAVGALVEIQSIGLRAGPPEVLRKLAQGEAVDPGTYYFRTALRFRTSAPDLAWLNDRLAIARGERLPREVRLAVFEVL